MQSNSLTTISPSFTTHSSNNLADVAARVVQEFHGGDYDDIFNFNECNNGNNELSVSADTKTDTIIPPENMTHENDCNHNHNHDDDDEFEFAVVCTDVNSSSISPGHILHQYPLFDRSLLLDVYPNPIEAERKTSLARLPLRKLFSEDRDFGSSSSSEADDLDGIAPGTYCVWKPNTQRCKKSNSTGNSSRRWKFRDIFYRSNSASVVPTEKKDQAKKAENREAQWQRQSLKTQ